MMSSSVTPISSSFSRLAAVMNTSSSITVFPSGKSDASTNPPGRFASLLLENGGNSRRIIATSSSPVSGLTLTTTESAAIFFSFRASDSTHTVCIWSAISLILASP